MSVAQPGSAIPDYDQDRWSKQLRYNEAGLEDALLEIEALRSANLAWLERLSDEEMDRAGRIFDKDWSHYDFGHVVFEPLLMSRETLDLGVAWISRQFYSRRRVARRIRRQAGYLPPSCIVRGSVPLNLGYRIRFQKNGTLAKGARFDPAA